MARLCQSMAPTGTPRRFRAWASRVWHESTELRCIRDPGHHVPLAGRAAKTAPYCLGDEQLPLCSPPRVAQDPPALRRIALMQSSERLRSECRFTESEAPSDHHSRAGDPTGGRVAAEPRASSLYGWAMTRLPLAVVALLAVAACSSPATTPSPSVSAPNVKVVAKPLHEMFPSY
jgi:hypothetical protein